MPETRVVIPIFERRQQYILKFALTNFESLFDNFSDLIKVKISQIHVKKSFIFL